MTLSSKARKLLERVHEALQETLPPGDPEDTDLELRPEGSVLTHWVVLAAWTTPNGDFFLQRVRQPEMPDWIATGLLHESLFGDWEWSES